ncbi:MAG: NAD(+) synthase [Anaeroplasmataceae bacterium]
MFKNGFLKVACITPSLEVGNPNYNVLEILKVLDECKSSIAVFPELCISGYTCGDLFYSDTLVSDCYQGLDYLLKNNKYKGILVIGAPLELGGSLFNCAIVIKGNEILGVVPKRSLPNNKEFYEKRWFKSSANENKNKIYVLGKYYPFGNIIFSDNKHNIHFGIEICEDMWSTVAPGNILALNGCNIILNLSASNETLGKDDIRRSTVLENSRRNCGAYVYASAGVNESTSDTVYSGHNIIASVGKIITETENFSLNSEIFYGDIDLSMINYLRRQNSNFHDNIHIDFDYQRVEFSILESDDYIFESKINPLPFVPNTNELKSFEKIASLQESALIKRLMHTKSKTIIIGVSGGLDSTLALLVSYQAFKKLNKDPKDIIAVTMPGFGTSDRTKSNAMVMMENLGLTVLVKPIGEACMDHFKLIEHDPNIKDVTYENTQARMRTLILMDLANKYNGIVLGTGDLSELALGWCTYNGDQMSMYGINAGIPKTLVRFMVHHYALTKFINIKDTLLDICDTPISPELSGSDQKTEDAVGKYEINDYILYRHLSCGDSEERIVYLLTKAFMMNLAEAEKYVKNFFFRFFTQQFKRQALPDGPKILDVSLSPRGDYRIPSDIKRF